MKKKIFALFLTLVMALSLLPTAALAAEETGEPASTGDSTKYHLDVQYYGETDGDSSVQNKGGTVIGEGDYESGASVTITVSPDTDIGYCAAQWHSTDLGLGTISAVDKKTSHTFSMPANGVTVSITFVKHAYGYHTGSKEGTHDDHCIYCGHVKTTSIPCVDETKEYGYDGANGYCDKCQERIPGKYILTFDANHNDAVGNRYYQVVDVSNSSTTLPANGFTLDGHTFQGWSTDSAATKAAYQPGDTYTVEGDTIFYAIWIDDSHVHNHPTTWSSDKDKHWHECKCGDKTNEGSHNPGNPATATTPQTCTVCGYEIAPAMGYTLTLNYNEDSTGVSVDPGSKTVTGIAPGTVVDLSAHWPANKTVTVGETTYYFAGFEQNKGGTKVESPTVTVNSDLTLNANWTTTPMVSLTFETNNGTMPYAKVRGIMYRQVGNVNSIHIPVRSGYNFVGWSLANDGTADSGDTLITADCTLYAIWQQDRPSYDDGDDDANDPVKIVDTGRYTTVIPGWGEGTVTGGVVIVDAERTLAGEVDLTGLDAQALSIPGSAVEDAAAKGSMVTIRYPSGTAATLTSSGLVAASDALHSGESLQIAVTNVDAKALPEAPTAPAGELTDGEIENWIDYLLEQVAADTTDNNVETVKAATQGLSVGQLEQLRSYLHSLPEGEGAGYSTPCGDLNIYLIDIVKERENALKNQSAPTYIHVGGKRATLVGTLEVDVKAARVDGSTRNVQLKADRSDAFAWSTNIAPASLEELIAMLGNAAANDVASNIKAYKVLDNGGLEAKAAKVTLNADGTLTASALSNGNSLYIFVYVPEEAPEETPLNTELPADAPDTAEPPTQEPPAKCGTRTVPIWVIVAVVVVAAAGGVAYLSRRKKDSDS